MSDHIDIGADAEYLRVLSHAAMLDYAIDAGLANEMRTALRSAANWIERQSNALQAAQRYQIGSEVTDAINDELRRS